MKIDTNTKIATILKGHPRAIDAIVSVSSKFEKLRNPVLRKLMAGRTSIAMACKMGGCTPEDFYSKLQPLGFEIDKTFLPAEKIEEYEVPAFLKNLRTEQIMELDVRPIIQSGKDPLSMILKQVRTLGTGQVLKIVNSFEPAPLMLLLRKQGFESYAETIKDDLVLTYFYKTEDANVTIHDSGPSSRDDWDGILNRFSPNLQTIDVRRLEMPLPMLTILENLENLPCGKALFVYHKRVPVFLLPELRERKFNYRIKEINDAEVHLLIFRD
jgi:uncharacterized protein (DUF2249 family)